ncbi:multiple PDZ domain protein-like isoform X3 [Saccostrea echinata]|uniref:multiple PDZ domain protein-like isoform X3 n=1 Tax=Saccostrea echinata TaxID=191078 RepID=UPI002A7FA620|nr:multiple PDZ domain protein-like isoform X3 [Saccostrea echinata]
MSLIESTEQAVEYVEHLQARLWDQGDHSLDDDMTSLLAMMESPLFRQILNLQESLQELKQVAQTYPVTDENFEITYSGQLILNMPPDGVPINQALSDSAAGFSSEENLGAIATTPGYDAEFQKTIERVAKGREIETIKLFKPENTSLGFSVVGLKGENNEETGIFVQDIQPGGIAARDGRLRERDQILAIDGQPLDISHQEAIRILQSARGLVVLIIARGYLAPPFDPPQLVNAEPAQSSVPNVQPEVHSDMVLNTEWTQIEVIDLINDGSGLGFGIFGGRSTGVIVKTILPGGIACIDGRLHSGDHILQIGEVNVRGMSSEQVAAVLRQSGSEVRLIVARPVNEPSPYPIPHAPIVPTHQLDEHLQQINALLHGDHFSQQMADDLAGGMIQVHMPPYNDVGTEYPEVEYFDVTLMKDSQGLGITIAGYVGKDNAPDDLCGIFVKSVAENSAADQDGRIQVNDQIIKVDNQPLHGFTNHQAVEVLRNTGQMVHLQLARFQHGPKYEKLQQYLAQPHFNPQQGMVVAPPPPSQMDGPVMPPMDGPATITSPMIEQPTQARLVNHIQQNSPLDPPSQQVELHDITLSTDEDYSGDLSPDVEEAIKACWEPIVGSEFEVVVTQLSKFREGGGLGISLEGTVDVEKGVEVRPHHYIRFILSDGPVGINGHLKSGDELLEVNGRRLLGLNHKEVVGILKELPQHVRLVCARHKETENYTDQEKLENGYNSYLQSNYSGVNEVSPITERLVKAKSENTLASTDDSVLQQLMKNKSRSLEELTNFKMWSIEPVVIELCKGDKGLGFSILDYKDPENVSKTVIVIKSLVPGGVAQVDGRLLPGDRLIFVNDEMLENASLDEAVDALKGAPKGIVRIGVKKALPLGGSEAHQQAELQHSTLPFPSVGYPEPSFLPSPPSQTPYTTSPEKIQRKFTEQYSSTENVAHKQNDSFYESDEEVTSPRKNKPITSPRRSLDRRKRESTGSNVSYENSQVLLEIKNSNIQKDTVQKKFPVPQPRSTSVLQDYVNSMPPENLLSLTQEKLPAEGKSPLESPRSESPADYENTTFALPTYEEAISGDPQPDFFNMSDLDLPAEAPPVPPRSESQEELFIETEQILNHTPPDPPSDFEESPRSEKGGSTPKRTPPPIPPKPKVVSPKVQQIVVKPANKDTPPPPLPVSLPPALDEKIHHTEEELSIKTRHQKTNSVDSQQSSSSDQPITSDLTNFHSPSIINSANHITPPSLSPLSSPRLARTLSGGVDSLPVSLEKVIKIKKARDPLGLTVEAVDKGANGCMVKSLINSGAVSKDGRIKEGDYIVSVNNESMRRITNAQARAIIRRASLQGLDISVAYIPKEDAAAYQETAVNKPPTPPHPSMMPSPNSNLSPLASPRNLKPESSPERSPLKSTPLQRTSETVSPRVKSLTSDGSPATGNQTWGPPRTVELEREPGKSLGISIVGGRVDMFNVQTEQIISGIFIKHVLEDSPAGQNGTLKTGDRILEVDGKDLRNAAHDQAVDIIRHAKSPVKFIVQSLCDPACPRDLENDTKSVHSYDEASLAAGQTYQTVEVPILESVVNLTKDHNDSEDEDEFGYTKKKIQRQYGDLNGELHLVDLNRGNGSLGINLAGNKDRNTMSVFVAGVQPESVAGKDGRIQVGDELLEVNGQVLYGRSHLNASAIIKSISTNIIKFVLLRRSDNLEHMAVKPVKMTAAVSHEDVSHTDDQEKNNSVNSLEFIVDVVLEKGASGLGFAIVEDMKDNQPGIYIRSITPGGVAAQDGRLSVGDQILEVGDKPLTGVHYDKAIEILRNMQGTIKLKVRKNNADKKLSLLTANHLDPDTGTKNVFHLQSAPGESSTDPNPAEAGEEESTDPKTCPIIPGRETTIEIEKGRTGLGLSIVGGADTLLGAIIVHEVYEEGAAARDGRLWAGDQVLEVNHEDLKDATHDYAIQVLRQTPSTVQIKVFRDDAQVKEEDIYDIFTVELTKKPGRGLGLSIVGKRNDVGVYISDIVRGGTAESDGRLMQGDQILAVNKEDMRNATQEYAAAVLKTLMGKVSLTVGRLKAGSRASSRKNSNPSSALKKSESSVSNKSKGGKHSKGHSEDTTHIRVVELEHDITGSLGLSIAGGIGSSIGDSAVIIANMSPAGPAAKSGKLKIGDKILSINDVQLDGMSHDEVVQLLKKPGTIKLAVSQGEDTRVSVSGRTSRQVSTDMSQEYAELMAQDNVFQEAMAPDEGPPPQCKTLHLNKGPDGLGFSIVGGHGSPHGDLPIYVKNVFAKGAAADEGNLKRGDQIISVNGQSLEGCTHDEAVSILKNARGAVTMTVLTS